MNQKVLVRSSSIHRRPSRKMKDETVAVDRPKEKRQLAEVAGGSAAECTAICCCCPWTVLNLVVFAVYKMPAGLCRKALKKRKRRRVMKKRSLLQYRRPASPDEVIGAEANDDDNKLGDDVASKGNNEDIIKLEEEMWGRFSRSGFWRSPSQAHT